MRVFDVKICENGRLTCYICDESPEMPDVVRDAMLVLPGGGYGACCDREGEPIVKKYLAAGMNAFCLRYSVGAKAGGFMPLVEASYAMKYIRENAKEFNIDPERIFAARPEHNKDGDLRLFRRRSSLRLARHVLARPVAYGKARTGFSRGNKQTERNGLILRRHLCGRRLAQTEHGNDNRQARPDGGGF